MVALVVASVISFKLIDFYLARIAIGRRGAQYDFRIREKKKIN